MRAAICWEVPLTVVNNLVLPGNMGKYLGGLYVVRWFFVLRVLWKTDAVPEIKEKDLSL